MIPISLNAWMRNDNNCTLDTLVDAHMAPCSCIFPRRLAWTSRECASQYSVFYIACKKNVFWQRASSHNIRFSHFKAIVTRDEYGS
jgi:hypothetical protein